MAEPKRAKLEKSIASGAFRITDIGKVPLRAILESIQHLEGASVSIESLADTWTVFDLLSYGSSVGVRLTHKSPL